MILLRCAYFAALATFEGLGLNADAEDAIRAAATAVDQRSFIIGGKLIEEQGGRCLVDPGQFLGFDDVYGCLARLHEGNVAKEC